MTSLAGHFTRFLTSQPGRLHAAAHSHHPWPDITREAQLQAWDDAALHHDDKWDAVWAVMREAQAFVARRLGLPDPASIAFGPNTHGFVMRLLSCLPTPARVLTTDAEFHSFTRQIARLEEDGLVVVERVAAEPFATFQERMGAAAARGGHDLVFFSQVLFDSGFVVPDVGAIVAAVPEPEALVVVDGYHAFMALPADHGPLADRAFFLGGGYKYAMAGRGPASCTARPATPSARATRGGSRSSRHSRPAAAASPTRRAVAGSWARPSTPRASTASSRCSAGWTPWPGTSGASTRTCARCSSACWTGSPTGAWPARSCSRRTTRSPTAATS